MLFWLDNGGYGSCEKTGGGGAIFQRCAATMFGVRPGWHRLPTVNFLEIHPFAITLKCSHTCVLHRMLHV